MSWWFQTLKLNNLTKESILNIPNRIKNISNDIDMQEIFAEEYESFAKTIDNLNPETPFYVYALCRPEGHPFYIGKGKGLRLFSHLKEAIYTKKQSRKNSIIRKLIRDHNWIPTFCIYHKNLTEDDAFILEIEEIARFGRIDNNTGILANHTDGGEGISGLLKTPERIQLKKDRCIIKYGVDDPNKSEMVKQKKINTLKENYGEEYSHNSQVPAIRDKKNETMIRKYGAINPSNIESSKKKREETSIKNRGISQPLSCPKVREKSKQTSLLRYGTEFPSQSDEVKLKIKETNLAKNALLPTMVCPHCDRISKSVKEMNKFHFDRCSKNSNKGKV